MNRLYVGQRVKLTKIGIQELCNYSNAAKEEWSKPYHVITEMPNLPHIDNCGPIEKGLYISAYSPGHDIHYFVNLTRCAHYVEPCGIKKNIVNIKLP